MRVHHRVLATSATALLCLCTTLHAGDETLKDLTPPVPSRIFKYVQNRDAAEAIGKALFWDEQTGGDGIQACATCHFSAGGDTRDFNQVNPHGSGAGGNGTFDIVGGSDDFAYIGVRPISEDPGRGNGEIKTPTLSNVELSGPYMHTGGFATLRQVVEFYDRGGDFPNTEIDPLGLSESEKVALVDFLLALTDERVRTQAAPFDHPQLHVPNGPTLPAVGRTGGAPLLTFLGLDPQTP